MQTQYTVDGRTYQRVAWTGGGSPATGKGLLHTLVNVCRPLSWDETDFRAFQRIRGLLYREQLADWQSYWGDLPDLDTRLIFWGRATYDAWRTVTRG